MTVKLKNISYRRKNKLLLPASLFAFALVYLYAVRGTIELRSQCMTLQLKCDSSANAPLRLKQAEQELDQLNMLSLGNDSIHTLHELILGSVTAYCHQYDLVLRDYASPVRYRQDDWIVETHPVMVEGKFVPLLKLIHSLEQSHNGKIVSVNFEVKKDNRTQQVALTATIYIQNLTRASS